MFRQGTHRIRSARIETTTRVTKLACVDTLDLYTKVCQTLHCILQLSEKVRAGPLSEVTPKTPLVQKTPSFNRYFVAGAAVCEAVHFLVIQHFTVQHHTGFQAGQQPVPLHCHSASLCHHKLCQMYSSLMHSHKVQWSRLQCLVEGLS